VKGRNVEEKKKGFAADPERARSVAKRTKSKQSPEERSYRARLAAQAKWKKYRMDKAGNTEGGVTS